MGVRSGTGSIHRENFTWTLTAPFLPRYNLAILLLLLLVQALSLTGVLYAVLNFVIGLLSVTRRFIIGHQRQLQLQRRCYVTDRAGIQRI